MNPNSVAAAGDHVLRRSTVSRSTGRFVKVVWVASVAHREHRRKSQQRICPSPKKSKRNLDRALIPVRNGADEPVLAAATSQRDEFPWTAIEHAYLIPRGRHLLDEFEVVLAGRSAPDSRRPSSAGSPKTT